MSGKVAIIGYGPVGRALADRLMKRPDVRVSVMQRSKPASLGDGVSFQQGDVTKSDDVAAFGEGADHLVCTVGFPYRFEVWNRAWPVAMENMLAAAARNRARFVLADNLYMYGPVTGPLKEDLPLTAMGGKPGVRAAVTKAWQAAHAAGTVKAVAVRASDFYGPDVATSVISEFGVRRMVAGKAALVPYDAHHLHDFTYVPDFARALETLIDAPDDAYGQAWHVPNARPVRSLRTILQQAATMIGVAPRISVIPRAVRPLLALVSADLKALREMDFQWDRDYVVDHSKFGARFWDDPTSLEEGLAATIAAARASAGTG